MSHNQIPITKQLKIRNYSGGQMVLMILLVGAVVMTIALSLSKKTVTDIKIDTDEELSKKAFDTAESGIDYYRRTATPIYYAADEGGTRVAEVTAAPLEVSGDYTFEKETAAGHSGYFWLVDHLDDGSLGSGYFHGKLEVCLQTGFAGALKIDYFYKEGDDFKVKRYGYNIGNDPDKRVEGFEDGVDTCSKELDFSSTNSILLAVTPVFSPGKITIRRIEGDDFPAQGEEIVSTGKAGDIDNLPINRTVRIVNQYQVPGFLLEAISAEGSVSN
ncbi:MAG TPA: hypothetical protein P5299_02650 [Candidatus Woesebacteria bacterium]|nr:hypothetical protein [Candidatus Woesebacteria bacterium]